MTDASERLANIRRSIEGLAEGGNETFLLQQYDRLGAELRRARNEIERMKAAGEL